ncbi:sodium:solute symporter family transporter [Streptomyces sp. cg40]|uniref:sodium:solute symporter family transporter n=1 Tax=Streptomyces sp. cg40 TaxID=3419764 RepID=UPI003D030D62
MNSPQFIAAELGEFFSPLTAFMLVLVFSFLLCLVVGIGNDDSASEFFVANRKISTFRNTLALCGDWIPTSALLATVSGVAIGGFDGMVIAASVTMTAPILLLMAERLRAAGEFTLGDILARRFPSDGTRLAAGTITLVICILMTVIQLTVAGNATAYVLGLEGGSASQFCTILIGLLIIMFAAIGGMRGTSMIQAVKTVLVLAALLVLAVVVLNRAKWDLSAVTESAGRHSGDSLSYFSPGRLYGDSTAGLLDTVSLGVTAAFGSAVLPHVVMRLNVFRDGRAVRQGVTTATVVLAVFAALATLAGLGAAATVASGSLTLEGQRNVAALFQLAEAVGGDGTGRSLLGLVSCAVFLTSLSTASGLTLAIGSLAHDLYSSSKWRGKGETLREISLARWFIVGSGALGLLLAVELGSWSIVALTSFGFAVAASTVLPALAYSLFWKDFTRAGLYATLYGSFAFCLVLELFSPSVSGSPGALLSNQDFHWFPMQHIALVSVPVGFLLGWACSRLTWPSRAEEGTAEALGAAREWG